MCVVWSRSFVCVVVCVYVCERAAVYLQHFPYSAICPAFRIHLQQPGDLKKCSTIGGSEQLGMKADPLSSCSKKDFPASWSGLVPGQGSLGAEMTGNWVV